MDEIKAYKEMMNFADRDKGQMYNDRAEKYEHIFRNCVGYADPDVTAQAAGDLKLPRDCKIIEFGTGTGLVGQCMKDQGVYEPIVDGIDASEAMLERAR